MTKTVNICDVCNEIFAGGDAPKNNMSKAPNERHSIPIFSNGEENEGLYGYTDKARVTQPSITVSARGTIGYTAIRNTPFVPIVRLITLTPNPELIDINYLYYAVRNYKFDGSGTSIPQLTVPSIKKYSFPLPTKEEQKRIALLLDNLCELIEKRKKQLTKLDELVKARFVEMFGNPFVTTKWTVKELKDISESMIDGSNVNPNYYEPRGEVLFLRIQNVWRNEFRLDDSVYITQEINHKYYYDTSLKTGDLLITKIGRYYTKDSSLGRVSVYRGGDDCANYSNNIMRVRLNGNLNSEFVNVLLNLDDYQSYIKRTSKGGTDKRALSKSLIGSYPIIIPPIELQNEFAAFVEQTDKSKIAVQKALDEAQTLFDSLMQEYFG